MGKNCDWLEGNRLLESPLGENHVSLLASFGKVCFQIGSTLPDHTKHKTGYGLNLWEQIQWLPVENTTSFYSCSAHVDNAGSSPACNMF